MAGSMRAVMSAGQGGVAPERSTSSSFARGVGGKGTEAARGRECERSKVGVAPSGTHRRNGTGAIEPQQGGRTHTQPSRYL